MQPPAAAAGLRAAAHCLHPPLARRPSCGATGHVESKPSSSSLQLSFATPHKQSLAQPPAHDVEVRRRLQAQHRAHPRQQPLQPVCAHTKKRAAVCAASTARRRCAGAGTAKGAQHRNPQGPKSQHAARLPARPPAWPPAHLGRCSAPPRPLGSGTQPPRAAPTPAQRWPPAAGGRRSPRRRAARAGRAAAPGRLRGQRGGGGGGDVTRRSAVGAGWSALRCPPALHSK